MQASKKRPIIAIIGLSPMDRKSVAQAAAVIGAPTRDYASPAAFLASPDYSQPGCLVADLAADDRGGCTLVGQMSADRASMTAVLLVRPDDVRSAVRAMQLGVYDVLARPLDVASLIPVFREAAAHSLQRHAVMQRQQECLHRIGLLSPRERAVLDLVLDGQTNRQIADALGISHRTVEVHRGRIMRKTQSKTIPQMVHVAVTAELIGQTIDRFTESHDAATGHDTTSLMSCAAG